jgi:hypothetical protein
MWLTMAGFDVAVDVCRGKESRVADTMSGRVATSLRPARALWQSR